MIGSMTIQSSSESSEESSRVRSMSAVGVEAGGGVGAAGVGGLRPTIDS